MAFVGFVATDVNVFRWKNGHHFLQYMLEKSKSLLVTNAKLTLRVRLSGTGQLRINSQHLFRMSGHFYFGNDRNVPFSSVLYYFAGFFLGIKTAVSFLTAANIGVFSGIGCPPVFPALVGTPGSYLREKRIFFDFESPARSVGDVPVKTVDFQVCHHVKVLFHKIDGIKMTANIDVNTPIREAGKIGNCNGGDGAVGCNQLKQGLNSVK